MNNYETPIQLLNKIFTHVEGAVKSPNEIINLCKAYSFTFSNSEKLETLKLLINNFSNIQMNISIFNKYEIEQNFTFIDYILVHYCNCVNNIEESDLILQLINIIFSTINVKKTHIEILYRYISNGVFYKKNNFLFQRKHLELLELFYKANKHNNNLVNKVRNFFYFNGNNYWVIKSNNDKCIYIKDTFAFNITFLPIIFTTNNETIITLISFKFNNNETFEIIMDTSTNSILFVRNNKNIKESISLFNNNEMLNKEEYTNIGMIIKIKQSKKVFFDFTCVINSNTQQIQKNILETSLNNVDSMNEIMLFKNYIGYFTSFIFWDNSKYITLSKLSEFQSKYKCGMYKLKHLNNNDILTSSNPTLIYMPHIHSIKEFLVDDITYNNKYICFINSITPSSSKELSIICSGYNIKLPLHKHVFLLGGMTPLLPLCELFLLNNSLSFASPDNFEFFINIISQITTDHIDNMKTALNEGFFEMFSLFLEKYPNEYFTLNTFNIFKSIATNLFYFIDKTSLYQVFFTYILLNIKIYTKFNLEYQFMLWEFIYKFCNSDITVFTNVLNITNLINAIRSYYDITNNNEYCCTYHSQIYFNCQNQNKQEIQIMNSTTIKIINIILKLCELLLFIDNDNRTNLTILLNFISLDISPCITRDILQMFGKYLNSPDNKISKSDKLKTVNILIKNGILNIICFIIGISFPDVINSVIYVMSGLSRFKAENDGISKFFEQNGSNLNYIKLMIVPYYKRIAPYENEKEDNTKGDENDIFVLELDANENVNPFSTCIKDNLENDDDIEKESEEIFNLKSVTTNSNDEIKTKNDLEKEKHEELRVSYKKKLSVGQSSSHQGTILKNKKISFHFGSDKINEEHRKPTKFFNGDNGNNIEVNPFCLSENKENVKTGKKSVTYGLPNSIKNLNRNSLQNIVQNKQLNTNNDNKTFSPNEKFRHSQLGFICDKEKAHFFDMEPLINFIETESQTQLTKNLLEHLYLWLCNNNINNSIQSLLSSSSLSVTNDFVLDIITHILILNDISFSLQFLQFIKTKLINNSNETKESNAFVLLSNDSFHSFLIETYFQSFFKLTELDNNDIDIYLINKTNTYILYNEIITIAKEVHAELITLNDNNYKLLYTSLNNILTSCTKLKCKYNYNKRLCIIINDFLRNEIFNPILTKYTKSTLNEGVLVIYITIIFEFIAFYNIEHKDELSIEFNIDDTLSPLLLLSSLMFDINSDNSWRNSKLFDNLYSIMLPLFSLKDIQFDASVAFLSTYNSTVNIINEIITNKKKCDFFQPRLSNITVVSKLTSLSLCNIISNLFISVIQITTSTHKLNQYTLLNKVLVSYYEFLCFIIFASTNISYSETNSYNHIQEQCYSIIMYALLFLYEHINIKIIEIEFNAILTLCLMIYRKAEEQIAKKKKKNKFMKMIKKISNKNKKLNLSKCAVYKIINDNFSKVFPIAKINTMYRNGFIEMNSISNSEEFKKVIDGDMKEIKLKVKMFFEHKLFYNKCKERINAVNNNMKGIYEEVNEMKEGNWYDLAFYKVKNKCGISAQTAIKMIDEEIKTFKEKNEIDKYDRMKLYKKAKTYLFSFNGSWSLVDLFYNDIHTNISLFFNNYYYNDNELRDLFNKYRFKFKLINHYGNVPYRPILMPIYDIISYLPLFSQYDVNNLFLKSNNNTTSKESNLEIASVINLNIPSIIDDIDTTIPPLSNFNNEQTTIYNILFHSYSPDFTKLFTKLKSPLYIKHRPNSSLILNGYSCCYVKQSHHIHGYFNIKQFNIFFSTPLPEQQTNINNNNNKETEDNTQHKSCYGSYFSNTKPKYKSIIIPYNEITLIFTKTYYYNKSAIEIFTSKNKSYYFNFKDNTLRNKILKQILSYIRNKREIKNDLNSSSNKNEIIGYEIYNSSNELYNMNLNPKITSTNDNMYLNQNHSSHIQTQTSSTTKYDFLSYKIALWQNYKLSTFELLLWLNLCSNRSFNDISQYPVVPWIIARYNTMIDETSPDALEMRDLSFPMGMLELNEQSIKRKKNYINKFDSLKDKQHKHNSDINSNEYYIYGTHYSNPIYVCHYLTRIFPFSAIMIELQGNKFDDPNRMFRSVKGSFECATTQEGDIRELTPEFYYLPEMFMNINGLNLGIADEHTKDNVELPDWCDNNNPYSFIIKVRRSFENLYVSAYISKWIDLIFGFKQKGKEAENVFNLYVPSSYDVFDIDKINDKDERDYYLGLAEFGLTPHQLFGKEFNGRKKKEEPMITISAMEDQLKATSNKNKQQNNSHMEMLKMKVLSTERVMGVFKDNLYTIYRFSQSSIDAKLHVDLNTKKYAHADINNYGSDITITIFNSGKYLLQTGYIDGKMLLIRIQDSMINSSKSHSHSNQSINTINSTNDNTMSTNNTLTNTNSVYSSIDNNKIIIIYNTIDYSPIVTTFLDSNDKFLLCGTALGSVLTYSINQSSTFSNSSSITTPNISLSLIFYMNDHLTLPITSLSYNPSINVWGSSCKDGYIHLYTFPTNKKISSISFYLSQKLSNVDYLFISSSPLASFVIYAKESMCFYSYAINGFFLCKENENDEIHSPRMFSDKNYCDYLLYGTNSGNVVIREFPNMEKIAYIEVAKGKVINCVDISEDKNVIYAYAEVGQEIISIKDPRVMSEVDKLIIWHMGSAFN